MHNAFITFKGDKISKSSGGLFTVFDLINKGFDPMAFRYMVLGSHYRKGIEFSLDNLQSAEIALNKLRDYKINEEGKINLEYKNKFINKISDDLAMPEVMAIVWKMLKSDLLPEDKWTTLLDFDKVLGLGLDKQLKEEKIPKDVLELVEKRNEVRKEKNWVESDKLREIIKIHGYLVEDSQNSCKIHKIK